MLAPFSITRGLVVDASKEVEVLQRYLLLLDAQLVVQLSLSRPLDAFDALCQVRAGLAWNHERVGAASVGPHVREGDLLRGTLLQEKLVLVVEEKDGKGTVEKALVDVGHEMA